MSTIVFLLLVFFIIDCYRRIENIEKVLRQKSSSGESLISTPVQTKDQGAVVNTQGLNGSFVSDAKVSKSSQQPLDPLVSLRTMFESKTDFLGENWLVKVGVLLLVLSLGWFVTYAFSHDWIGPIGRVLLGVIFGGILLGMGTWRFARSSIQGIALLTGGVASIYVSVFAGMTLYNFYTPIVGLFFMGVVTAYMMVLSGFRASRSLSFATLIYGFVAPLFVWGHVEINILAGYLFVLSFGVIVLDVILGWRATTLTALIGVFFYTILSFIAGDIERTFLNFFIMLCFTCLFYFANVGVMAVTRSAKEYDLGLAALVGFTFFSWVVMTVDAEFIGLVFTIAALVFALSAYVFFLFLRMREPILMYAAVSAGFLFAATAKMLDGSLLTTLLAVEIGGLAIASFILFRERGFQAGKVLTLLMLWPTILSFGNIEKLLSFERYDKLERLALNVSTFAVEHLFVLGVLAMVYGAVLFAGYYLVPKRENGEFSIVAFSKVLFVAYSLLFVWFFLHEVVTGYYVASMIALILFTGVGLYFHVSGILWGRPSMQRIGMALFIIVLARLFLVEFWTMSSVEKIITFFVVGALFLSTAFLLQKRVTNVKQTEENVV